MPSVNWYREAAGAVQVLRLMSQDVRQAQMRVMTGLSVASPRDNGAVFAIASGQKARLASYAAIAEGMARAKSLIDVTLGAGMAVSDILLRMKAVAGAARSNDLTPDQRAALQADYDALRAQIDPLIRASHLNAVSLAGAGGADMDVLVSDQASAGLIQTVRTSNTLALSPVPQLASRSAAGVVANAPSEAPRLSADGRYAAFVSTATNLTPDDTNVYQDIFVKDLQTGAINRVSTDVLGQPSIGNYYLMDFSSDGRFVLFSSSAPGLVPADTNGTLDIFIKDVQTGAVTRVSTSASGAQATSASYGAAFSADGQSVIFQSDAPNLVPGDTNNREDTFLKNLQTGAITRLSTGSTGVQGNLGSQGPALSPDGSFAVFMSEATNLVAGDTNAAVDIFLKNIQTGVLTRVSVDAAGLQASGPSFYPALSSDGRYLVFGSTAANLVPGDTNGRADIFIKDLQTGSVTRVSTSEAGAQADGHSMVARLSPDGRYVAFESDATNLTAGDTNGFPDVFVKDLQTGAVTRIVAGAMPSVSPPSHYGPPFFSADGRFLAFNARDMASVPDDTNGFVDAFVIALNGGSGSSTGIVPALAAYVAGNAGVTAADDTQFRIDGELIGTVDITATMTVAGYLDAVRTATGGRVVARYDAASGEFIYETAAISGGAGVLTLTSSGTARSWLGHGLSGSNGPSGQAAVITLQDRDWTVGGSGALAGISFAHGQLLSAAGAGLADAAIDTALVELNADMAALGAKAGAIESQARFNTDLIANIENTVSQLIDADLARDSARLQSLQIRQQLATQALSIANQTPQVLLSLFARPAR